MSTCSPVSRSITEIEKKYLYISDIGPQVTGVFQDSRSDLLYFSLKSDLPKMPSHFRDTPSGNLVIIVYIVL